MVDLDCCETYETWPPIDGSVQSRRNLVQYCIVRIPYSTVLYSKGLLTWDHLGAWTGCQKLNLFVLGRQLELIGPPQHRTIVDIMSDDSGNHWGVVGELKTTLIWIFLKV